MAAGNYALPPPAALEIHHSQASERWRRFRTAWANYSVATGLNGKGEDVQVATLLTVIGEEAREVYTTFTWEADGDNAKIKKVIDKFQEYCQPYKNIPFERYKFNQRAQEVGESYDHYRTCLRTLADECSFATITQQEILRDRLVFGIRDAKVRERLLREPKLTLAKTDEICRAAESTSQQLKLVEPEEQKVHAIDRQPTKECWRCGRKHGFSKRELCPAYGKTCNRCHKPNHFAVKCRQKPPTDKVKAVEEQESEDETYYASTLSHEPDDAQLITVELESGNFLRFQVDTGAQCNVIPLDLYKKAAQDPTLTRVTKSTGKIVAYGGSTIPVMGTVMLNIRRKKAQHRIKCKLVPGNKIRPLLGRSACLGMNIISYLDNDSISMPEVGKAFVFTISQPKQPLGQAELIQRFPQVFREGVGCLKGEYRIQLDPQQTPVQHPPRRVPVALRDRLKATLDDLERDGILATVTEPTEWVSSLVIVPKKDGRLRLCLDPKDLNKAILREHFPLPTIEEVATRLCGAKCFSLLDVRNGFWHVPLDEDSSLLTTFNTPFGRYRWTRLPFGISSAPEVFQRKMYEVIEGLHGVEVIADDFLVVGFGDTEEQSTEDHDTNLEAFLERCIERDIRLNSSKMQLRLPEVPFIGHVASSEGLRVDPHKVQAIVGMPPPEDVNGVKRILGFVQYLSKFLPRLSDLTKPLRDLTSKEAMWIWGPNQQAAFDKLKEAVTGTPVLRYYNVNDEVTIQCDASQSGLGATLMQFGQPVAYASRALTEAETRYAQIEKELLAIVFACEHFEYYIYGRDVVNIETDHEPLVSIVLKPLHKAPSRLQRMLLRLQRYNLKLRYKEGPNMFLADTLSRAYLSDVSACAFASSLTEVDHTNDLTIPESRIQELREMTKQDPVLRTLSNVIQQGWPKAKSASPECVHLYFDLRDELTVQGELVFKGQQLVIPYSMRKQMMTMVHESHIGIDGCLRRARECMYWPRMSTELKEFISKCDVCLSYRSEQTKEPLEQHCFAARPWSKIGVDLCELDGRNLLVAVDYYSNFVEVERLTTTTSSSVIKPMKEMFARYGVPDTVISDNGPQFDSAEFSRFAKQWNFEHTPSSPRYPQSNGKVENAVKTVKRLFKKCKDSGTSEFQALLDWRNTPSEGMSTSPAQRFFGRRCRTLLPMTGGLLKPSYSTSQDSQDINKQKAKQRMYYDRHVKPLKPLESGSSVRLKLPGESKWSPAVCSGLVGPRRYQVVTERGTFTRNRRQILETETDTHQSAPETEPSQSATTPPVSTEPEQTTTSTPASPSSNTSAPLTSTPSLRRSTRQRKQPSWLADYEHS